eukprot:6191013-Pleurochrysis_carterae.AAC.5
MAYRTHACAFESALFCLTCLPLLAPVPFPCFRLILPRHFPLSRLLLLSLLSLIPNTSPPTLRTRAFGLCTSLQFVYEPACAMLLDVSTRLSCERPPPPCSQSLLGPLASWPLATWPPASERRPLLLRALEVRDKPADYKRNAGEVGARVERDERGLEQDESDMLVRSEPDTRGSSGKCAGYV